MNDEFMFGMTFLTALGCGLIGGVFFAFSSFVMRALGRVPSACGIAAMQSINVVAVTPLFMTALFGTAIACVLLVVVAVARWQRSGVAYVLAGAVVYLAGCIVVTIACNVPRNNALAAANASSAEGARLWADYVKTWTAWNHVRTISGLAAASLMMAGLLMFASTPAS